MELITALLLLILWVLIFMGTVLDRIEHQQTVIRRVLIDLADTMNRPDVISKFDIKPSIWGYSVGDWLWYSLFWVVAACGLIFAFTLK